MKVLQQVARCEELHPIRSNIPKEGVSFFSRGQKDAVGSVSCRTGRLVGIL